MESASPVTTCAFEAYFKPLMAVRLVQKALGPEQSVSLPAIEVSRAASLQAAARH